jgi:hypothetical protein
MSTAEDLQRAYQLIKEDKPSEAEALLLPILAEDAENIDAWWLMAYAVEDPNEVREALNKVLELDPDYAQAPKAREMLAQLDAQFPPPAEEDLTAMFGEAAADVFGDSAIDESFFEAEYDAAPLDEATADEVFFEDDFGGAFEAPEGLLSADELFPDLAEDVFEAEAAEKPAKRRRTKIDMTDAGEPLDDEARAALEEKTARREGRARRWLTMLLFLLVIIGVPAAVILFALSGGDEDTDPGPLETIVVDSELVNDARFSAGNELRSTLGTDSQAVTAKSPLGDTLFAKVCAQPGPNLSEQIWQAMDAVARQAPLIQDELAAVGVSIENCDAAAPDTYYRASVSVEDAIRYADGEFDDAGGPASFQALWRKS